MSEVWIDRTNRKHIYLSGFMGSGKSTVGPPIAKALGYRFVDLDEEIENRERKTIEEIFRLSGESFFRNLEFNYLSGLLQKDPTVFALGGGTVTIEGVIPLLKTHGIIVYLKTEVEELVLRLRNHIHRPLLLGDEGGSLGEVELQRRIEVLLSQREIYYREADIIIQTSGVEVHKVIEKILSGLVSYQVRKE